MPTDRVQEIAAKHELGGWLGNQFVLDQRCLAALREMERETRRECAEALNKIMELVEEQPKHRPGDGFYDRVWREMREILAGAAPSKGER